MDAIEGEANLLIAISKFMNEERTARYNAILEKSHTSLLEPRDVDEYNGIVWYKIGLLKMLAADTVEKAFEPEGKDYAETIKNQFELNSRAAELMMKKNKDRAIYGSNGKQIN